jgi:hypothetical protein
MRLLPAQTPHTTLRQLPLAAPSVPSSGVPGAPCAIDGEAVVCSIEVTVA